MKKTFLYALLWPLGIAMVIMAILHLGGDFPDIHSYVQPRLGAALLVMLIVSFGLFFTMNRDYLKRLFPWAAILALLWAGTFTWAYGFASLPEKKHLGDYYVLGAVLFALPYVYTTLTAKAKHLRSLWTVIAGIYTFFMVLLPFIYIGYYVLFGGEMDMFAMMAVRSTHVKEIKDFLRTMGSPMHLVMAVIALGIVISCAVGLARSMMKAARSFEGPFLRGSGRAYTIGLAVISILFFGGFYRQITHVFPASIIKSLNSKGSEYQLLQKLNDNLDKNVKTMAFVPPDPGDGIDEGTHIVIIGESANRDHMKAFTPDYPENTTPWLSEMAKSPDFALGYHAYSNFPNTLFSLSYAMTSATSTATCLWKTW